MISNDKFKNEILLKENDERFSLFPVKYPILWDYYKKSEMSFWTAEEIDLGEDIKQWKDKLNDNERHFIKYILAFFANADSIVNENLAINFMTEVQLPEARAFYATQIFIETIHAEVYSLLIDTYIQDTAEKQLLFNAYKTVPAVEKKAGWALKWISSDNFVERLVAFVCVEGIFFSGSFCSIFWLKNRGLMPGLSMANDFISRDEGLHCEFACELYAMLSPEAKLTQARIEEIIKDAVEIEKEFITESLPISLIGMNSGLMIQYIEYVTDFWLQRLGYKAIYNSKNPFSFMDMISVEKKANFFEKRPSEYTSAKVGRTVEENAFTTDAEF
jgi:ribonucleoside-diphosphate reductase beta chain